MVNQGFYINRWWHSMQKWTAVGWAPAPHSFHFGWATNLFGDIFYVLFDTVTTHPFFQPNAPTIRSRMRSLPQSLFGCSSQPMWKFGKCDIIHSGAFAFVFPLAYGDLVHERSKKLFECFRRRGKGPFEDDFHLTRRYCALPYHPEHRTLPRETKYDGSLMLLPGAQQDNYVYIVSPPLIYLSM